MDKQRHGGPAARNLRFALAVAVFELLSAGQSVLALPVCQRDMLQKYMDLTDGCILEDKTVKAFSYTPGQNSPEATAITVIPILVANFPGVTFTSNNFEAAAGEQQSFDISFQMCLSG